MHPAQTGIYGSLKGIFYIFYSASSFVSNSFSRKKNYHCQHGPISASYKISLHKRIPPSFLAFFSTYTHSKVSLTSSFDFIRPSLDPTLSFPPEPNFFKCAYILGSTPSTTPKAKVTEDTGTKPTGPSGLTLIPRHSLL